MNFKDKAKNNNILKKNQPCPLGSVTISCAYLGVFMALLDCQAPFTKTCVSPVGPVVERPPAMSGTPFTKTALWFDKACNISPALTKPLPAGPLGLYCSQVAVGALPPDVVSPPQTSTTPQKWTSESWTEPPFQFQLTGQISNATSIFELGLCLSVQGVGPTYLCSLKWRGQYGQGIKSLTISLC